MEINNLEGGIEMAERDSRKGVSRRDFIKGTVAGASAVALTGIATVESQAAPIPKKWDMEADIVVIGAGGAGLLAAIQAQSAGAKVLVYEKAPTVYASSTSISGGGLSAAGTKAQKAQGIADSPEKYYADMMKYGEFMSDSVMLKLLTENAASVLDWLSDNGMSFIVEPYGGHSVNRFHRTKSFKGKDYVDTTWKVFQSKKIPIEFETSAQRLFYDPAKQRVVGVEVMKGKKKMAVKARLAVILACGGFTGDAKTFDRLIPAYAGAGVLIGGAGNQGDGIKMAVKDAGGFPTHLQYSATYPMGIEVAPRSGPICRYYYFCPRGAILVNKEGKRFVSEETPPTKITLELAKQTEKSHFMIADSAIWEETFSKYAPDALFALPGWSMAEIQQEIKNEKVLFKADTVTELAAKAKLDAANLEATVNSYNGYVKTGEDPVLKRSKKTLVREIAKPPFYAVRMTFWTCLTLGGVRTNQKLQVLDPYDAVIPGLYAAGETVGGIHGAFYMGGCAMAWAHTSGYLAGKSAATEKPVK
jgi:fumarate reductase flavoprotein subunit